MRKSSVAVAILAFVLYVVIWWWLRFDVKEQVGCGIATGILESWLNMVALQAVAWIACGAVLMRWWREARKTLPTSWNPRDVGVHLGRQPVAYLLFGALMALLVVYTLDPLEPTFTKIVRENSPLRHHVQFFLPLHGVALPVTLLGVLQLFSIRKLFDRTETWTGSGDWWRDVEGFVELQRWARNILAMLGGMIGIVLVCTGLLRSLINEIIGESGKPLRAEPVVLYGTLFTVFLAIGYFPVHRAAMKMGARIIELIAPRPELSPKELGRLEEWRGQQEVVAEMLEIRSSLRTRLETGITVLAPLVGSPVSLAIPGA